MASKHRFSNRVLDGMQVHCFQFTGNVASGSVTHVIDLPPGAYAFGGTAQGTTNNHTATFFIAPYTSQAQNNIDAAIDLVRPQSVSVLSTVTLAATSTISSQAFQMVWNGNLAGGQAARVSIPHGLRFTLTTVGTAGSGSWSASLVFSEV